jgi:metallophosphoesterase (TIGR00282 family)
VILDVLGGIHLAVINLIGRVHMDPAENPFTRADELLVDLKGKTDIFFVDMHAEATSETRAMGWYLDGRVAAVLGSHTHVPTADEEILPRGTAYLTDAGMTGPYHSVIGMAVEPVLHKFLTGVRRPFEPATEDVRFCAALVDVEESTGLATHIERICQRIKKS